MKVVLVVIAALAVLVTARNVPSKNQSPEDHAVGEYFSTLSKSELSIVSECKDMLKECLAEADEPLEHVKCLIKMGMCMGAKVAGCSKQCVAPLIRCKLAAIGDWHASFKCFGDFIRCAIGGCRDDPGSAITSVEDAAIQVYFEPVQAGNAIIAECKQLYSDCRQAAAPGIGGILQRAQCLVQFGICIAIKTVNCTDTCVPPMLQCKLDAKGSFIAFIKCNIAFIKCAAGGCLVPGGDGGEPPVVASLEKDSAQCDVNPESRVECGFAGITKELCEIRGCCFNRKWRGVTWCYKKTTSSDRCMVNPENRIECGWAGITRQQCEAADGCCFNNETPDVKWCYKGVDRLTETNRAYELVMNNEKRMATIFETNPADSCPNFPYCTVNGKSVSNNAAMDACVVAHTTCMINVTSSFPARIKCIKEFGMCIASSLSWCAITCAGYFLSCMNSAGSDMISIAFCSAKFYTCAKAKCSGLVFVLTGVTV